MFEKITGQKKAVSLLSADLESGRVAESYLFAGPQGVGKRTTALEFAKAINCTRARRESLIPDHVTSAVPCGNCNACKKIESGNHPDVFVLDFESQADLLDLKEDQEQRQKELRIEALRILIGRSYVSPLEARKKIFVIDGAELLSTESANSLLKVLEESPRLCHWFLVAVSAERVLATIHSRCRKVAFSPLTAQEVEEILRPLLEEKAIDKEIMSGTAAICGGSVSQALSLLETETRQLVRLAEAVLGQGPSSGAGPLEVSQQVFYERKKLTLKKQADRFLHVLALKMAEVLRDRPDAENAGSLLSVLEAQQLLGRNVSPQTVIDALLTSLPRQSRARPELRSRP